MVVLQQYIIKFCAKTAIHLQVQLKHGNMRWVGSNISLALLPGMAEHNYAGCKCKITKSLRYSWFKITGTSLSDFVIDTTAINEFVQKEVSPSQTMCHSSLFLLFSFSEVCYLECDVGQTEFTPPAILSLNHVTTPLLGMYCTLLMITYLFLVLLITPWVERVKTKLVSRP